MSLLAVIFLAFAYRCRGGGINLGVGRTTLARILFWALPVGLVCTFIAFERHFPLWIGAISAITAFLGCLIGHSSFQNNTIGQNATMGAYGALLLALVLAPFIYFQHTIAYYIPFGLLGGLAYFIGWHIPFGIPNFAQPASTEMSEFFFGSLAFGLPLALIGWS